MKKYVEKLIAKADMQMIVLTLLENGLVHQVRILERKRHSVYDRSAIGNPQL